jgi:PAS domain S-box-containing protein
MSDAKILIADDELPVVHVCTRTLTEEGYRVYGVNGGKEAIDCLEDTQFDLLLVDLLMPDVDGLEVLRRAKEIDPGITAVIITAHGTLRNAIDALQAGARGFLLKPFGLDELLLAVGEALEERRREQENLQAQALLPILEISQTLMASGDVTSLASRLLEVVVRQVDTDRASLMLLDEKSNILYPVGAVGLTIEAMDEVPLLEQGGVVERALLQEEPLVMDGGVKLAPSLQRSMVGANGAVVYVPLRTRQKTIGVLTLGCSGNRAPFTKSELDLLSIMSNQIATALDNARLYEAVTQSTREWEATFNAITDGISIHDRASHVVRANHTLARMLDIPHERLIGQKCGEVFSCGGTPLAQCPHRRTLEEGAVHTVEVEEPRFESTFLVSTYPLRDAQDEIIGSVRVMRDITERKRAEEGQRKALAEALQATHALRESEERFRTLFDNSPLCIFEVDFAQTSPIILRANQQAERVYGWSAAELTRAPLDKLLLPEAISDLTRMVSVLQAEKTRTIESVNQRRDGSIFPVRISATLDRVSGVSRIIIVIEDITAEKNRRSEEEAIAEERRRIAREIHDGLAQDLASLRLRVSLWHGLVDQNPAEMHAELDALRELLRQKIRDVRRSIFALRPVALDELGFFPALRRFVSDFGEQNQLYVELHVLGPEGSLLPSLEPVLFRIVQEALNNVGKHAYASTAWVGLDLRADDSVTLTVRDNGVGFDPAILDQAVRRGHLGLKQMGERVEGLEGTLLLKSEAGQGTEIRVVLPLSKF